jgi:hypothetical protein
MAHEKESIYAADKIEISFQKKERLKTQPSL